MQAWCGWLIDKRYRPPPPSLGSGWNVTRASLEVLIRIRVLLLHRLPFLSHVCVSPSTAAVESKRERDLHASKRIRGSRNTGSGGRWGTVLNSNPNPSSCSHLGSMMFIDPRSAPGSTFVACACGATPGQSRPHVQLSQEICWIRVGYRSTPVHFPEPFHCP
jgi:hypothetical protein